MATQTASDEQVAALEAQLGRAGEHVPGDWQRQTWAWQTARALERCSVASDDEALRLLALETTDLSEEIIGANTLPAPGLATGEELVRGCAYYGRTRVLRQPAGCRPTSRRGDAGDLLGDARPLRDAAVHRGARGAAGAAGDDQ